MRNPNGYGTVAKLSGNRRNPFVVRKTIGFDDRNYPIYQTIGYVPTREEGLMLLAQFNKDPWNLDGEKITFEEIFKHWTEKKSLKLGERNQTALRAAFGHCKKLYNIRYKTIKAYHMQDIIDNCGLGYSSQRAIKNLFGHLDKFAFEMDIINKCYSDLVTSESAPETSKLPFTDEEVKKVWNLYDLGFEWADSVLVFLYSGWRISELLSLKTDNVDLKERTIKGGTKSQAGKNRIVPIHTKIHNIIENKVREGNEYLFSFENQKCTPNQYYTIWSGIMKKLKAKHSPHECRHTFRSRLDSAGANKVCIDLMMGHKSREVGERVYTHKTIQELKDAIELIKN